MKLRAAPVFVAAFASVITLLTQAQQPPVTPGAASGNDKAKAKGGGTPKGISWPSPPLPDSPYKFDTGVERNLTLTITKGLRTPFSAHGVPRLPTPSSSPNAAANSALSATASSVPRPSPAFHPSRPLDSPA